MFKYFSGISKRILICYALAAAAFIIIFGISYTMLRSIDPQALGTANIVSSVLAFIVIVIVAVIVSVLMSGSVISRENDLRAPKNLFYHFKRIAYFMFLMALLGFAVSFAGGLLAMVSLDIFTTLREDNFKLYSTVIKVPMFIVYIVIWFLLTKHAGSTDTAVKTFNPHFMLIVLVLTLSFMLPMTVSGHMYENSDDRGNYSFGQGGGRGTSSSGKISFDVQTVFSSNEDLYKDNYNLKINENFSGTRVLISVFLAVAIQIIAAMIAYNMGRKKLYAKYPSMSEEEINSRLPGVSD